MADPADEDLMRRVGEGDRTAFRMLLARHLDRAMAVAWRILGNRSDAEDVAQDAFLRVWTHASRFRPEGGRFTTWLYRVVVNLCIDRRRRMVPQAPLDAAETVADPGRDSLARIQDAESDRHVRAALASLPDRQRAALVLTYYEGLSNAEAAKVLEVSVAALEALLVRGRRQLRTRLGELAGETS